MPPVVILAPTLPAARLAAYQQLSADFDEALILASSHAASRGWRRVLQSQNGNGSWLPRIATPAEYFLEAATFDLPNAPLWITPTERRLLLRDLLPRLRRRLKYLARLSRSSDLVRQLDILISDLREAGEENFALGGDWGDDLRLIVETYNRRLRAARAVDIECAPRLWAEYSASQFAAQNAPHNLSLFDDESTPTAAQSTPRCVVFDQLLAPSPAQWQGIQALAAQAEYSFALVVAPWLGDEAIANWDEAARLMHGTAPERVLRLWREAGAQLRVVATDEKCERHLSIRGLLEHRPAPPPTHLSLTACHTPHDEVERIASHLRDYCTTARELDERLLILPNATNYAGVLESTLEAHEIPARVLQSRPLVSYPIVARALRLLGLHDSEWTLDEVSDLFGDGVFRACCSENAEAESVLDVARLRAACVESRFDSLLDLDVCRERIEAAQNSSTARRHLLDLQKLERDLSCLRALRELSHQLGQEQNATRWAQLARESLSQTTCHLALLDEAWAREALQQIDWVREAIAGVETFASRWIADAPRRADDFLDWLRLHLENGAMSDMDEAALEVARPQRLFCDVPSVVYLAGLTENEWPQNAWGGTLLTRHRNELSVLREHRGDPAQWAQYQLALCLRESSELHLLHPQWENGREVLRSPLLEDALLCWGELPSLPISETPSSRPQLLKLLARAAGEKSTLVEQAALPMGFDDTEAAHLSTLATIYQSRRAPDGINKYDGKLGESGAAALQKYFAASGRQLKLDATKLKTYAQCPLKYFFREVLRLRSPDKLSDDFIGRESGTLLHSILERFTREYTLPLNRENLAEAWAKLSEIARFEIEKSTVRPVLRAAELRRLLGASSPSDSSKMGGILGAFLREEVAQSMGQTSRPAWSTPLLPHAHSGYKLPQSLESSLEAKFNLTIENFPVEGRFDRIDIAPDASLVAVVDYKTERNALPDFTREAAGLDFQLPLYLLAARDLFGGDGNVERPRLAAAYFHVREAQYVGGVGVSGTLGRRQNKSGPGAPAQRRAREMEEVQFHTWLDETAKRIGFIGQLAARGNFNLTLLGREDAACKWCDYSSICRRDDAVIAERRRVLHRDEDVYYPQIETQSSETDE